MFGVYFGKINNGLLEMVDGLIVFLCGDDGCFGYVYFVVGKCICFVKNNLGNFGGGFESCVVFNENVVFSVNVGFDYDGGGSGKVEGVRVGKDDN